MRLTWETARDAGSTERNPMDRSDTLTWRAQRVGTAQVEIRKMFGSVLVLLVVTADAVTVSASESWTMGVPEIEEFDMAVWQARQALWEARRGFRPTSARTATSG